MARLTEKQTRFVQEYLVDLNATKAAVKAGYSEKTAEQIGYQLLQKTSVQEAIQKAMAKRARRTEITQDMVLRELAAIGFARTTDHVQVNENGHVILTPTDELTDQQQRAVAGIKEGKYGIEIQMHNKVKALELLGQHLGMFRSEADRQEQEARIARLQAETKAAQARAQEQDKSKTITVVLEGDLKDYGK